MRVAYHTTGSALSDYDLGVWLAASKLAFGAVASPGALITLADPRHPHAFETAVLSDDRTTQGGAVYSRILGTVRRGRFEFNTVADSAAATWRAWHVATYGGRIPFLVELPLTSEVVIVKAAVPAVIEQTHYKRWQPAPWELVEWSL